MNRMYLKPAMARPNLTVSREAQAVSSRVMLSRRCFCGAEAPVARAARSLYMLVYASASVYVCMCERGRAELPQGTGPGVLLAPGGVCPADLLTPAPSDSTTH